MNPLRVSYHSSFYPVLITILSLNYYCVYSAIHKSFNETQNNYHITPANLSRNPSENHEAPKSARGMRSIPQLATQLLRHTKYNGIKLAQYGNWCGRGGDRKGDGSYIDECDLCCKIHDLCYGYIEMRYPPCNPRGTYYKSRYWKKLGMNECLDEDCPQETCICDVEFIECMKREPCSPEKVYKSVSYFWWLGRMPQANPFYDMFIWEYGSYLKHMAHG